jgi:hypothetical protein
MTNIQLTDNSAVGGAGGAGSSGGAGGNGQGGGLNVNNAATVTLAGGVITRNKAKGGTGGRGLTNGAAGMGLGGGVYLLGPGSVNQGTKIKNNSASTSDNDVFGSFT